MVTVTDEDALGGVLHGAAVDGGDCGRPLPSSLQFAMEVTSSTIWPVRRFLTGSDPPGYILMIACGMVAPWFDYRRCGRERCGLDDLSMIEA